MSSSGPITVDVSGLRELSRKLKKIDKELPKKVRLALNDAASDVASGAAKLVTRRSGKAAASYRARSTQSASRVSIGGSKAPHAPWLDFGGRVGRNHSVQRKFYKQGRYLFPTLGKQKPEFSQKLLDLLVEVAKEAGFEET